MTQAAEERGVTLLQEEGEAELTGSDPLLDRAVYHLAENAIKYNRPGGFGRAGSKAPRQL